MSISRALALSAVIALTGAASANAGVSDYSSKRLASADCFSTSQWSGWSAPDNRTLYLRVRVNDVYRVDVKDTAGLHHRGSRFLVNDVRGSDRVCSPIDLRLSLADTNGFRTPIFVERIVKLTPEEVAALPKGDRP